ncbi:MAG: hypothetical protein AUK35_08425 [Zetaproteobacteria bacterium CG2_30_46_52]|nr:MAG: hypothetical protein AUK35_08425 [Zetaproteobacteria bacterium CG2_30_46_52]
MKSTVWVALTLFALLGLGQGAAWANEALSLEKAWNFKVYLDDSELGSQRFEVTPTADGTEVRIQATFDYEIMFVNMYSYRHRNLEVWKDGCLSSIEASTDDDGETFFVSGTKQKDVLLVRSKSGEQRLQGCVKTYAYWDPSFLKSEQLLNSQTGEYQSINVQTLGADAIEVAGKARATNHYKITNNDFDIELWYDADTAEWLGLRSTTADGNVLRYDRVKEN